MRGHGQQIQREYLNTVARGSAVGSMIGSVIPGIGTVVGGIIGGICLLILDIPVLPMETKII